MLQFDALSAPQVRAAAGLLQQHVTDGHTRPDHSTSAEKDEPAGQHQASDAAGGTDGEETMQPAAADQHAADAAAEATAAMPLQPSCTVVIRMDPSPEYVVAVLACVALGCANHPRNALLA
jgi:acyl-CoA synthetase (AMP-forming)/AMP-acid ligase II